MTLAAAGTGAMAPVSLVGPVGAALFSLSWGKVSDLEPFLALESVSKTYPGVQALSDVSLSIGSGEVVGLIGENGAGKSTLMKILGGVIEPASGRIRLDGTERPALTVGEAQKAGIAFVHQELNLFDNLDVASNVFIGREPRRGPLGLVDRRRQRDAVQPLLDRLGVDFRPDTPVADLSIAQRQLLEIIRALSFDARVVIMDEPTSSLTISETAQVACRHRRPEERRGGGHLHLASAERGRRMRRSGRGAERRPRHRPSLPRGHRSRRDDTPHDRAGPEVALHGAGACLSRRIS